MSFFLKFEINGLYRKMDDMAAPQSEAKVSISPP